MHLRSRTRSIVTVTTLVVGVGVAGLLASQAPSSPDSQLEPRLALQAAGQARPTPTQQPRRRRRGPVSIMSLDAPWQTGATIPVKYTQAGDEVSPPLSWDNVPEGVVSFALLVHDLSAPTGQGTDDVLHWLAWNIPATARQLSEGVPQGPEQPDGMRQISVTGPNYRGPAAPASGAAHVYAFELYALDAMLDVEPVVPGQNVAQTRAAVLEAMAGRVRGKGVTVGHYRRQ